MTSDQLNKYTIGWIGAGRMGYAMAARLAKAGCDISVYNRTRAKAEPLSEYGAKIVDAPSDLAGCDVVFSMVSTSKDLHQVIAGDQGVLKGDGTPGYFVDCSSVSEEASAEIRATLADAGAAYIAAPVSGNAKVVKAGKLTIVASGPRDAFDEMKPYLETVGAGTSYVGEGELARTVKICHNVHLAVVTQSLAELTVLAQKAGVPRHAFLDFMNKSVMGSMFTAYKTPSWVNQDYSVTFTPELMQKDVDLGLELGRNLEVPMTTASVTRDVIQASMGQGNRETVDFGIVLDYIAKCSGLQLESENMEVGDGLSDDD
jgi:3-hydroxyisobutyrate dehydrogenase